MLAVSKARTGPFVPLYLEITNFIGRRFHVADQHQGLEGEKRRNEQEPYNGRALARTSSVSFLLLIGSFLRPGETLPGSPGVGVGH